jgi:thioredoxin reductase (NADPH)
MSSPGTLLPSDKHLSGTVKQLGLQRINNSKVHGGLKALQISVTRLIEQLLNIMIFDLIIIGAGPIGLACGLEAQRAGLSYLILEKGCLVNSLYHYPLNMTFFSTSEKLEIGGVPFVSNSHKPTRSEALEYYRRVAQSQQLQIHLFEEVKKVLPGEAFQVVETSKSTYHTRNVVLATGFYDLPVKLNIPGEDLPKVSHYYKDPHFYAGMKVAIVGANNSAVDAALETYRKGAEVTMIIRGEKITDRVKYWVKPDIENRIKEGSIKAFFESNLLAVSEEEIKIQTPEGIIVLENDFVLAMTGYQPDFRFLRQMGIELSEDLHPFYDKNSQESNLKHIFLAGVVCGGLDTHVWFIENSRVHAEVIVREILADDF